MEDKQIYLDYSATTPCDPMVVAAMMPYFTERFGNAGSRSHSFGWDAEAAVEDARGKAASAINAAARDIIFTSGATESNNIAIKGAAEYLKKNRGKNHIITLVTEHKCVIESCSYMEEHGFDVTYLDVRHDGIVDLNALNDAIRDDTALISIAWVHNEIGIIQPIMEIAEICRRRGVLFHSDAAQALGRVEIDLEKYQIDLVSFSGHKIYAPKGIGALYVRPGVRLQRVISGGGQEKGIRSGTLAVPLCVAMGEAATIAENMREAEWYRMLELRTYMLECIMHELPDVHLNGSLNNRVPHNLNLSFACVEGESLMMYLKNIAVSSGSACTSGSLEPSYVISALGGSDELVHSAIRIVFGRYTTREEVEIATDKIIHAVRKLRDMSPLWSMKQSGIDLQSIQWAG